MKPPFSTYLFLLPLWLGGNAVFAQQPTDWSDTVDGLRLRLFPPTSVTPVKLPNFIIRCEIANVSDRTREVDLAGRFFASPKDGPDVRCLKYISLEKPQARLEPGQTVSWWQNGIAPSEGLHTLHMRWDENRSLASESFQLMVHPKQSAEDAEMRWLEVIRQNLDRFPRLAVNTGPKPAEFVRVFDGNHAKDALIQNGTILKGFRFTAPENGHLAWSFTTPRSVLLWFCMPVEGELTKICRVHYPKFVSRSTKPNILRGEWMTTQYAEPDSIQPGHDYIMCFLFHHDSSIQVSLNFATTPGLPGENGLLRFFGNSGIVSTSTEPVVMDAAGRMLKMPQPDASPKP